MGDTQPAAMPKSGGRQSGAANNISASSRDITPHQHVNEQGADFDLPPSVLLSSNNRASQMLKESIYNPRSTTLETATSKQENTAPSPVAIQAAKILGGKRAANEALTPDHGKQLISKRLDLPVAADAQEKKEMFAVEEKLFQTLSPAAPKHPMFGKIIGKPANKPTPTLGDFFKSIGVMPDEKMTQGMLQKQEPQPTDMQNRYAQLDGQQYAQANIGVMSDAYPTTAEEAFRQAGREIVEIVKGKKKNVLTHSYMEEGKEIQLEIPKDPGETIYQNHEAYGNMDKALNTKEDAIPSQWFKAAHEVTNWNGIGAAAPWLPNAGYLTDRDEDYLKYVHHGLAEINYDNFQKLYNGQEIKGLEGLRGKKLDYALVVLEQENVERLTNGYFRQNPRANKKVIMANINDASTSDNWFEKGVENDYVEAARKKAFPDGGYDINYIDHRIRLGKAMVEEIYGERMGR